MQVGLIISNITSQYEVVQNKQIYRCNARGKFKKEEELTPVVGDKVEIEIIDLTKKEAVITNILPRINLIKRPKLANLTQIILVVSAKMPKPDLLLLDKQLAFAEFMKIHPVIVLNKIDLQSVEEIAKQYCKIGYTVLTTNARQIEGVLELRKVLQHQISAFSGNSGVGKSTLLNGLFQKDITLEGIISQKNKKGKNTTTAIRLYELEEDTYIADTPGFSTFDLYEIDYKELYRYFKEFIEYEKECAFVGCTHIKEQECGIRKAYEQGKIIATRYENYKKIYEDLKDREEHKW